MTYSTNLDPGPKTLRLWQLGFRTDFGLPGMSDPEDMITLMQMILVQGFLLCTGSFVFSFFGLFDLKVPDKRRRARS